MVTITGRTLTECIKIAIAKFGGDYHPKGMVGKQINGKAILCIKK